MTRKAVLTARVLQAELVLLDHGLYRTINDQLRLDYAGLWQVLACLLNAAAHRLSQMYLTLCCPDEDSWPLIWRMCLACRNIASPEAAVRIKYIQSTSWNLSLTLPILSWCQGIATALMHMMPALSMRHHWSLVGRIPLLSLRKTTQTSPTPHPLVLQTYCFSCIRPPPCPAHPSSPHRRLTRGLRGRPWCLRMSRPS